MSATLVITLLLSILVGLSLGLLGGGGSILTVPILAYVAGLEAKEAIAASRMEIDQVRLLTLYAAWKMDTEGKRAARQQISAIKIVAANMVMEVLDRAIQIHGSLGMTDDTPLAALWRFSRMLRLADGPDEVHLGVVARHLLKPYAAAAAGSPSTAEGVR